MSSHWDTGITLCFVIKSHPSSKPSSLFPSLPLPHLHFPSPINLTMTTLPQSNTIVPWPNQPFTLTQDPPGIFFLHHVPEVKSFFKWILKQSLNDVPEDTQFPLVKQRIRSARCESARLPELSSPDTVDWLVGTTVSDTCPPPHTSSPRAIQGMNIFLRAVVMLELTDKDLQNNIRGPAYVSMTVRQRFTLFD